MEPFDAMGHWRDLEDDSYDYTTRSFPCAKDMTKDSALSFFKNTRYFLKGREDAHACFNFKTNKNFIQGTTCCWGEAHSNKTIGRWYSVIVSSFYKGSIINTFIRNLNAKVLEAFSSRENLFVNLKVKGGWADYFTFCSTELVSVRFSMVFL